MRRRLRATVGDVWAGWLHPVVALDGVNALCFALRQGPNDTQDGDVEDDESTVVVQHTTVTGSTNHDNDDIGSTGAIEVRAPFYRQGVFVRM